MTTSNRQPNDTALCWTPHPHECTLAFPPAVLYHPWHRCARRFTRWFVIAQAPLGQHEEGFRAHGCSHLLACLLAFASMSRSFSLLFSVPSVFFLSRPFNAPGQGRQGRTPRSRVASSPTASSYLHALGSLAGAGADVEDKQERCGLHRQPHARRIVCSKDACGRRS